MTHISNEDEQTKYTVFLVNECAVERNFWIFLDTPQGLPGQGVFANTDANISVLPNYKGINKFTVPLQYSIGAGSSNEKVGLEVRIDSQIMKDTRLGQTLSAKYQTVPPKQGPQLTHDRTLSSPSNSINVNTNTFDRVKNEDNKWFSNMSFGIKSPNGFMGYTWSPGANEKYIIVPKFRFFVTTGSFTENSLADINVISNGSVAIERSDFLNFEATVKLTSRGTWELFKGKVI